MPKYTDYGTLSPRYVEEIAYSRALEQARVGFGFPATLPEDATVAAAQAEIFAAYPSVVAVFNPRTFGAVGDGVTDDTAALRRTRDAVVAAGGGAIDFGKLTYAVFPGQILVEPTPLFDFSGLTGIELRSAWAKFIITGDFPVDAVRAKIFSFNNCHQITIGDFACDATGNRTSGGVTPELGLERRGGTFAYFINGCTKIRAGRLDVTDFGIGYWFTETNTLQSPYLGSRGIFIAGIKSDTVGYTLLTDNSGHDLTCPLIDTVNAGRSAYLQDMLNIDVTVRSKNFTASQDVGISGAISGKLKYINTESDSLANHGRAVGVHYPVAGAQGSPDPTTRNLDIELNIKTDATNYVGRGFTLGMSPGVLGSAIDPATKIQNLRVHGIIESASALQDTVVVDFPSAWTAGQNIFGLDFSGLIIKGAGNTSFDLRGVADVATLDHVTADANLQIIGNTVGKISCRNVTAPELFSVSGDTTAFNIDIVDCEITTGANLTRSTSGRRFINSSKAGARDTTLDQIGQRLQSFTVVITNTAGTLQHQILTDLANGVASAFVSRVTGANVALANTPTVAAGVDFTNGAGILSGSLNQIVFNTAVQLAASEFTIANVEYYDGNVVNPRAYAFFNSTNVNGTTRNRLHIRLTDAMTGAAWNVNTTNLPAGKSIAVKVLAWLA